MDELFTLIRETITANRDAGYARGKATFCGDSVYREAQENVTEKEITANEMTVRMWRMLYDFASSEADAKLNNDHNG